MKTQFKKSYSLLSNATRMLVLKDISPFALTTDERILEYSKILDGQICNRYCKGSWQNLTGNTYAHMVITNPKAVRLNNGSLILFANYNWIFVDINGPQKGPNRSGHDLHNFKILESNNLAPVTYPAHDVAKCSLSSIDKNQPDNTYGNNNYVGFGCSEYALIDKNPDGDGDYWYDFLQKTK